MKKIKILFVITILLFSCNKTQLPTKPSISGRIGEILIVTPKFNWEGQVGDTLREYFSGIFPGLPQPEPLFELMNIDPENFKGLFETHRNVIFIKNAEKAKITIEKNKYSEGQLITNVYGPNDDQILKMLDTTITNLVKLYNNEEQKRMMKVYQLSKSKSVSEQLIKNHNLDLTVPRNFVIDVDSSDFVWLSGDNDYRLMGILIYHYPYVSKNMFSLNSLISKRNEIGMMYVKGGEDESYMTTENKYPPQQYQYIDNGKYYSEIRGLWKMENGQLMGGPFVSVSTVDTLRNRIITVDGYVFAPNSEKRVYVRQLEAIVHSLEIEYKD